MVVGTLSLVQKGPTRGHSGCSMQCNSGIWGKKGQTSGCSHTVYTVHCVTASTESSGLTFLHQRTMSPLPYITIPLCPLHTTSTGLTFLHQRQCLHHHIPLPLLGVLTFFAPTPTVYCVPHCMGYDLLSLKVMVPTTHIC